ncbi:carbonate dehydratase [Methylomonas sp. AM2-LC]|uniref:carbonate dehydratase n=1 Tax=Methylomonas sp. AM2-LC TaxID=3153301 RepID=UPI0032650868
MANLNQLFNNNINWARRVLEKDPDFFNDMINVQSPKYLWVGCSDSRVPANQITGLNAGEIFVHRNVANIVVHTDLNCLSVIQYAIDVLKVEHIMVVGHYGCGGVLSALEGTHLGLIDNWLRHIQDVRDLYPAFKNMHIDVNLRWKVLCELNVIHQVRNITRTTVVGHAWRRKQNLSIHGWVYGLNNGLLKDLNVTLNGNAEDEKLVELAIANAISALTT